MYDSIYHRYVFILINKLFIHQINLYFLKKKNDGMKEER